jgi:1,2-diacylglycerol 3-alpha-glucosyltransferase
MRVGILTEFPTVSVQSGPAIHTRFLHDGLTRRGHEVVLIGPDTSKQSPVGDAEAHLFKALSYPTHPKVKIPFPWPLSQLTHSPSVELVHGQCNTHLVHYGIWLRKMYGTAVLNTHIIHLPTHAHFLLSDSLYKNPLVWQGMQQWAASMERSFADMYNQGDGLIVQSRHMIDYWQQRGVRVPIEAVGRPINPHVFSQQAARDPFPADMPVGKRLLVVCRHDREKNLEQLIDVFDEQVAPADAGVTLTLVGDGFDHLNLLERARRCRHSNRIHFAGEVKHDRLVDWYAHADVFVYTSLSETFGNVVNEALWCGLPAVALDDRMGVAHQITANANGFLIEPHRTDTDERFAEAVLQLVWNRELRRHMGEQAATLARRMSHPDVILSRYERFYEQAVRRARSEVTQPLAHASRAARARAFARHIGAWAYWNSMLVGVGGTATKIGLSRNGTDNHYPMPPVSQPAHEEPRVEPEVRLQDAAE